MRKKFHFFRPITPPPGHPWVSTKNVSPIGLAVWSTIRNIYMNVLFYYKDVVSTNSSEFQFYLSLQKPRNSYFNQTKQILYFSRNFRNFLAGNLKDKILNSSWNSKSKIGKPQFQRIKFYSILYIKTGKELWAVFQNFLVFHSFKYFDNKYNSPRRSKSKIIETFKPLNL